jgi:mannose-6-phosphate isomerase-like protein (cupin superfamily)
MDIRRIVTGHSTAGATVVSDERVAPITAGLMPGAEFHALWGNDYAPTLPSAGDRPDAKGWFPPAGGFRFAFVTLGPDAVGFPADFDLEAGIAEVAQKLPGMVEVLEPDNPGMHTTDTIDFVVVLSGEVWLELDGGQETLVKAGDVVIQNGTRHAWRNKTDEPCVMAVSLVGASRAG